MSSLLLHLYVSTRAKRSADRVEQIEAISTIAMAPPGSKASPISHKTVIRINRSTIFNAKPDLGQLRDGHYSFSIPFPTYLPGGFDLTPPSYTLYHLIASYQINYFLKIDVVRHGLRRHERVTIPILYLPRTNSKAHDADLPKYVPDNGILVSENDPAIAVDLTSKLYDEHVPTTNLILPFPKRFASGERIPVTLTWSSPRSPALTVLWSRRGKVTIELIKRSRIWVGNGSGGHSVKDIAISDAKFCDMDESVEGVRVWRWTLQAGDCAQKEMSWHVKDVADVRYLIRVSIEAPDGISSQTATVRHEEYVDVATDVSTADSAERCLPALGLITIGADKPICRA